MADDEEMRLQKYLSRAGYCSRRDAEDLMRMGRVVVDGDVCREMGKTVVPSRETVEVDGRRIELPDQFTYVALNKPVGCVATTDDPRGRETVVDLLPDDADHLWPVGRLDRDSKGLLLMTDDGRLTHRLTHPSFEARKRYRVQVTAEWDTDAPEVAKLQEGVELDDGYVTEPAEVRVASSSDDGTELVMILTEGKNRQIRRMVDALGSAVQQLERTAVGPVELGDLAPGETRPLTVSDIRDLYREVETEPPDRALPNESD